MSMTEEILTKSTDGSTHKYMNRRRNERTTAYFSEMMLYFSEKERINKSKRTIDERLLISL